MSGEFSISSVLPVDIAVAIVPVDPLTGTTPVTGQPLTIELMEL